MAELIDVMDAFSTPLKVAWAVWLTWGVAQVYWYRQERTPAPLPRTSRPVTPAESRPSVPPPVVSKAPPVPEPEPIPAPEAVESEGTGDQAPGEFEAASPGAGDQFDPANAVIETFSEPAGDLDSFVAGLNSDTAGADRRQTWPDA